MSTTIDQRVVEMKFDNQNFERNVQTSLSTLDKLKQGLNLSGAAKGLDSVSAAASRCNMSGLSGAIDTVHTKFSALQVMGVTALANITNSAVNAGKRIAHALTIEPLKTGLQEYETQINAVQTILANTQSKGSTLKDVNAALDELNTYADQTIYNFTEMTRNIGTFTAAGVDLDKSVTSIKGIANLAAISGSTSQQASTAMYQLSQALAAGRVSLMDWNSVVNAGMGGEVFQTALKRTARQMGINVDTMIEKYGSFRESLTKGEWLTAEVLTETLTQLSGAYSEADLIAQGYSEKQAKEITKLAETAVSAATDVKTFTQLVDTTKEAVQSGWTQSWEIIIGDFEQAKAMWTGVSKILNGFIEQSSKARNTLLQGWADGGGRDMGIEAISNAFDGLLNILRPVKEAFREVFPPMTAEQLIKITEKIRDLTEKFKNSTAESDKLKSTFKGMFSIIKMGVDVVTTIGSGLFKLLGSVTGISGGILTVTGSFGEWISGLTESVSITESLSKAFDVAAKHLKTFVTFIGSKIAAPGYEGFLGIMKGLWDILSKIGGKIVDVGSTISESLVGVFRSGDMKAGLDILNGGLVAGILLGLKKYVNNIAGPFDEVGGFFERLKEGFGNVKEILSNVRSSLEAYQQNLQAGTLMKIAGAVAILAGSITLIAMIDPERLAASLWTITALFGDLMGSMAIFNMMGGKFPRVVKAVTLMNGMATAILILAGALRVVATLDMKQLGTGLLGILGLTAIVVAAAKVMAAGGKTVVKGAGQMIIMAGALKIMASVLDDMSKFNWDQLGRGLAGMAGAMAGLVISMKLLNGTKVGATTGASLILLATSMKVIASAVKDFSGMNWEELGRGLAGMAGSLAAVTLAMKLLPKNMIGAGTGILVVSSALIVLAKALDSMSGMTWEEIGRGLTVLGGSMLTLAVSLKLMSGTLGGSAALIVATGALAALVPILKALGSMSWVQIATGLGAVAATFAVLGIAGWALTPVVPTILALSGALALLGISALAIGGGLALMATGIGALAVAMTGGAAAIVAGITTIILGIAGLIPAIAARLGEAIVVFCTVIGESATAIGSAIKAVVLSLVDMLVECIPAIADGALKLIVGVLEALVQYSPQIIDLIFQFIINLLNGLSARMPELIQAAVNVLAQFFNGIVEALRGIDSTTIVNTILAVGFLSALFMALSALSSLIPAAMIGVLGMGMLVAELAVVLAAIGMLAQIPGLQWLINQGGEFLRTVGNAIGQFVGGIAGGFAEGVSSSFPQIAKDLSAFMTNLQPFIEGAKNIDATMAEGVKAIASTILILTAADILQGITSWITGGSSMSEFAAELVPFGKALKQYSNEVTGIDTESINGSAKAAKSLVKVAEAIPNSGGLASIFAGENDISDFANKIVGFGKALKRYSNAVTGIDTEAINGSAKAAKSLTKVADAIPNSGGLVAIFSGDNNMSTFANEMVSFGRGLAKYSNAVANINVTAVNASITSARALVNFIKGIGTLSTTGVNSLKTALETLGKVSVERFVNAFTSSTGKLTTAGSNMINAVVNGIKSKQTLPVTTITTMLNSLVTKFNAVTIKFETVGIQMMTKFQVGVAKGKQKVLTTLTSMLGTILTAVRNKYQSFYSAGKYLVEGFANGISANTYKAAAKARAMAKAAEDAAKKQLDEHSPSKVAEEIGSYFAIGFVMGISERMKQVRDTSVKMGKGAKEGLEEGFYGSDEALSDKAKKIVSAMADAYAKSLEARENYWKDLMVMRKKEKEALEAEETEIENYHDKLDSSYNSLMEKHSLFSAIEKTTTTTTQTNETKENKSKSKSKSKSKTEEKEKEKEIDRTEELTKNLKDQIKQLRRYEIVMSSLDKKLEGTALGDAVRKMGVESINELEVLNSMTEENLNEYIRLYDVKCATARKAAETQIKGLGHDLATYENAELMKFQEEILENTKTILAEYTEELDRNTESLMNRSGIFKAVNEQEAVTAKQLIENLEGQIDQMVLYTGVMANLQNKLGETSLWSTISEMGVDSLAELQALDSMTEKQLDNYIALFESKYALAKEAASYQLVDLKAETENKLSELFGGATVELEDFIAGFDQTFESINTYVTKSQAIGAGMDAAMALGINTDAEKVTDATVNTVDNAVTRGERVAKSEGPDIGYYLVKGFANGITGNKHIAISAAYQVGKEAAEAMESALDENSPSKVGYNIGGFLTIGFANGITAYTSKAVNASTDVAESARNALTKAVSVITDFLESDFDSEPVIRPVVDLSNVTSGALKINAMFSRSQAMSISAERQMRNNKEIQNGFNTQKVGNTYEFNQYNYSPKALSRLEIYRQTKNQFSALKGLVET